MTTSPMQQNTKVELPINRRMQWFFLIALTFWTLLLLITIVFVFCVTQSAATSLIPYSILALTIRLWQGLASSFFPPDARRAELKIRRMELLGALLKGRRTKGIDIDRFDTKP